MPNLDGTGPNGNGQKTGRAQGNCTKNTEQSFYGRGRGGRFGQRQGGGGRGFGNRNGIGFGGNIESKPQNQADLQDEISELRKQLENLEQKLKNNDE